MQRYLPLELADDADANARAAFAQRIDKEGRTLLATEGYFNARLQVTGEPATLVIQVEPGARTLVEQVDITLDGAVPEERKAALREAWALKTDAPFRQADWSGAKEGLLMTLMERDFPAARLLESRAAVDADHNRARLKIHYDSGAAYRFGALEISGLGRYSPELVARYNRQVKAGDPYDENRLTALQSALENTPYFTSVSVRMETVAAGEAGNVAPTENDVIVAPVQVTLREQSPHRLNLGAGVSSNTGARVEVNFRTADLFSRAWQLNSGVRVEQLKQSAYADIFLPPTPEDYHYAFGALVEHSDIRNLKLQTGSLGISRSHRQGSVENVLTLSYITEKEISEGLPQSRNRSLAINSAWTWTPRLAADAFWFNHVSQIQIGGAIRPISDQNFVRLYGETLHNFRLTPQNILTLRAEGGIVLADSRKGIPQNFLFRAGGTQSVRGYGYQSLGIREGDTTFGGRYLLTASGEFTHWLTNSPWGVAAFVDVGNAGDDKKTFRLQQGYGVGARWKSEAGAVGVDLAYGNNWHLHFALSLPF
ncbi:outer membrane protein assembly factor [Betaproteobacteria bacterium]|nr:outer membrane protein assembly factor [Betaproteobacteria bacterium]GHU41971.1 outer membrane protein assembly factor [Betaproteobacteria bacterium]